MDHTEQDCRAHANLVFSERELIAIMSSSPGVTDLTDTIAV